MSILIKDMEMPKDIEPGLAIEFADGIDGKRYARLYHYRHGGLTEWLETVSIPPHGRCIDVDALTTSTAVPLDGKPYQYVHIDNIKAAPTIIPAEPEKPRKLKWREWNYIVPKEEGET